MHYEQPEPILAEDAEPALGSDDVDLVCRTLVRIVHSPLDPEWIQGRCLQATRSEHLEVRRTAATCLGHLARIHGRVEIKKVMPALRRLLKEPSTQGVAEDALEDIQSFSKKA